MNAEIELGWTGAGQTNRLLGRITMRSYIFHHVLWGGQPLRGAALVENIVETARSLPGYQDWCNHQHEIEHRAEEWARCIENSHYFRYGDQSGKFKASSQSLDAAIEKAPTWNQQRLEATRDRIRSAIADLLDSGTLPSNATARFKALLNYQIGGGSLYRHRDLWHPNYLIQIDETSKEFEEKDTQSRAEPALKIEENATSLLPALDSNHASSNNLSDSGSPNLARLDGNSPKQDDSDPMNRLQGIQQALAILQTQAEAGQEAFQAAQSQSECKPYSSKLIAKMQGFLNSGDPILIVEAITWAELNLKGFDSSIRSD
ncbi:hypothetical protein NC981_23260 [Leptolyngbya sp. DQ-M1]|uniref:hypothetical protein n=1 Tax=Leptolyngbya sp. DQ-M1 TaxID=2933920 RepID=UPI00329A44A4